MIQNGVFKEVISIHLEIHSAIAFLMMKFTGAFGRGAESMSISIQNILETKLKAEIPSKSVRKNKLIDNLSLNPYNFAADSLH